jgi:signal transduction histidine kinase
LRVSGGDAFLSQDGLSALTGAVDELLANVAKHAGVDEVTVRLAFAGGGVAASIVDGGRGFHPGQPTSGTGLRHSVRGRIEEAGGVVRLDSTPGQGASIEVWVPCQMWCDNPRFRRLLSTTTGAVENGDA